MYTGVYRYFSFLQEEEYEYTFSTFHYYVKVIHAISNSIYTTQHIQKI